MRVRMLAFGTQGDVQPYVALGVELKRRGHEVEIATTADFQEFVEEWGLKCVPTAFNLRVEMEKARAEKRGREARWAIFRMLLNETLRVAEGADMLLYAPVASISAPHVAEKLGIPAYPAMLQPFLHPTGDFPVIMMPDLPLGRGYKRWTYRLFEDFMWLFLGSRINAWRKKVLGLPELKEKPFTRLRRQRVPTLYAWSEHVLHKPREWGDEVHVTGYWFLPEREGWVPDEKLVAFLRAGSKPVYVGMGSMVTDDPERMTSLVIAALKQVGLRGVIATGWDGMAEGEASSDVYFVKSVPHSWLFLQMAAVVHHGGVGTTAEGLRAGVPTVVVAKGGDQPFWGRRVHELGVGPEPLMLKSLTVEKLAKALREAVGDERMREKAERLGKLVRSEDGVGRAVKEIEGPMRVFNGTRIG